MPFIPTGAILTPQNNNPDKNTDNNIDCSNPDFNPDSNNPNPNNPDFNPDSNNPDPTIPTLILTPTILTSCVNGRYYHEMTKVSMTKNMTKKHLMTRSPYD